jgi:hypothetical protein
MRTLSRPGPGLMETQKKSPWPRVGAHLSKRNNMKNKIEVGQTVFLNEKQGPRPAKVVKVGKKYFQIDAPGYSRLQFFIETLLSNTNYGSPDQVYLNRQELSDENEVGKLRSEIGHLSFRKLNLDQLRRIKSIIEEPQKKPV